MAHGERTDWLKRGAPGRAGRLITAETAITGGGPGGYEAALVAARLGAEVTIVDRDGIGIGITPTVPAAVLAGCVPSKPHASELGRAGRQRRRGAGVRKVSSA